MPPTSRFCCLHVQEDVLTAPLLSHPAQEDSVVGVRLKTSQFHVRLLGVSHRGVVLDSPQVEPSDCGQYGIILGVKHIYFYNLLLL